MITPLIQLLRPQQYVKNGFVLLGVVFSHQWQAPMLGDAALAFFAFCAIASAVYVLNDLLDLEADRAHPIKCRRPIACGAISPAKARTVLVAMLLTGLLLAWLVSPAALSFVVAYFLLNVAYSWHLKHVVIIDVFIIATGFMLRILTGTIGLGIAPSDWLLLCGLMITLFLGFAKRQAEIMAIAPGNGNDARRVLDDYSTAMLGQFLAITAACTIITYGLYTVSPETVELHGTGNLIYTLPFVVYGMFRYLFLLHQRGGGGDTSRDLLTDLHLLATVAGWLIVTLALLS